MDSGAFKHPEKKAITSAPKESFPSTKIPVPLKSIKHKNPKRQATNNIVCSTPVNAVKKIIFGEDIQQMSPIRNPSSASTSQTNSPNRLIDVEELEKNLQLKKIVNNKETEKSVSTEKEMEGSLYPFPLVNKVQVLDMVLCDSDNEIFPVKVDSKSKRGKNTVKKNVSTGDSEKITKNSNGKNVTTDKSILENKHSIKTRSNAKKLNESTSSANIFYKSDSKNEKEKKKANARTKSKNLTSSPKYKKLKTQHENKPMEIISIENKNFGTKNNSINESTEIITENEKIEIINNSAAQLRTKIDKIKKDIINGQTKNFTNLKNKKTKKTKKEILNGTEKPETNIQVLDVSNGTKTDVVIHNSNKNDSNNISPKMSNTTNSNNAVENTEKKKGQTSKSRGRPKTVSKKESNITNNNQEVRKSSRKRIQSSKYWFLSEPIINNSFEAIQNDTSKKSVKSAEKLKSNELPTVNRKSTRKTKKLQNADLPEIDKNSSRTSLKSQNDEIPIVGEISTRSLRKTTNAQPQTILHKKIELLKETISLRESEQNKKLSTKSSKLNTPKVLTAGKIRKSLKSKLSSQIKPKIRTKLEFSSQDDELYTTEEENDIPRDTLMLPTGIEGIIQLSNSDKGQKRKVMNNIELHQPKKVKLQNTDDYSFKNMALSVDVIPVKAGGLADVQINGSRCLLGCFGKFPRHLQTTTKNTDISVGTSIQNGHITTGVIEIEPAGRKKYEYAKKVNLLFIVLGGIAEVGIGNSSQVLRLGQDFYVPKDTPYYIFNVSTTEKLVLYFSKIL